MRSLRKLVLVVAAVLVTAMISAAPASALEVKPEDASHCSTVTLPGNGHGVGSGGCVIRIVSVDKVELGTIAGMILCDNEFEARVNEAGSGAIYAAVLSNCTGGTVVECREAGVLDNWPIRLNSETAMEVDQFCVTAFGFINIQCNLENIVITQTTHTDVEFSTNGFHRECDNSTVTVQGHWRAQFNQAHPAFEIVD